MRSTNSNDGSLHDAINKAIKLNRQRKYRSAIKLLLPLLETHPRSGAVPGYIGGSYFDLGEFGSSANYFRKATLLAPKSELASLGLFHSLWQLDEFTDAFAEMKRFLSTGESKEYEKLLREMAVEGRLGPSLMETASA